MTDETQNVKIGDDIVSLADIAGFDFADTKELRGFDFPKGVYVWEIDGEKPPVREVIAEKLAVPFSLKCLDVVAVNDPAFTDDPSTLIGKMHRETFFITTAESFGYLKAFLVDVGVDAKAGKIDPVLASSVGTRFQGGIAKRKDANDPDRIYTSISRNKLIPMGKAEASSVAKAVA